MTLTQDRYAVIGHPVEHSRSPQIHAAFAAQTREALRYDLLPAAPDAFNATVDRFLADGGAGLNVTLPFKTEAAAYADTLSDRARRAGAVNTLAKGKDGRILGDNTDGIGLLRDLERHIGASVADRRILILGAGGAVRGVVPVLLEQHLASLCVANRTAAKAQTLAADFADLGPVNGCGLETLDRGWDIVINAISAGLSGEMPAIADAVLDGDPVVYDMIYADTPTPFLRWAAERGASRRRDGFGMLVEQAAESFHLWRGVRPHTADVIAELRPGGDQYRP